MKLAGPTCAGTYWGVVKLGNVVPTGGSCVVAVVVVGMNVVVPVLTGGGVAMGGFTRVVDAVLLLI